MKEVRVASNARKKSSALWGLTEVLVSGRKEQGGDSLDASPVGNLSLYSHIWVNMANGD